MIKKYKKILVKIDFNERLDVCLNANDNTDRELKKTFVAISITREVYILMLIENS